MYVVAAWVFQNESSVLCAIQRSHIGTSPQPRRCGSVDSGRCVIASPMSRSAVLGCMTRFRIRHTQSTLIGPNAIAAYGTTTHGSGLAAVGESAARCGGLLTAAYHARRPSSE